MYQSDLQGLEELGGKLPCPRCLKGTNVRSKGPVWNRIRQVPEVGGPINVLYDKMVCLNCPSA